MQVRALFTLLACIGLLPAIQAQDPPGKKDARSTTARIEKKTYRFELAGKDIEYAQFIPSTYDKAKKTPLIVCLHGLFGTPQQFIRTRGLTDLAEKHGYILVAPMGYNTTGWYGARPLMKGKDNPENISELSEKDVLNVLEIMRKEYTVDPARIFLMGHSMGGGGTWHLAIEHPEIWAGLAPIAPATLRPAKDVEKIKHLPVIVVQGVKDFLVPPAGARKWVEEMKNLKMDVEYIEEADGDHINVVAPNLPKIFEFFNKHSRKDVK